MSDLFEVARADGSSGAVEPTNYRPLGNRNLGKSWKARAEDNLRAIQLAKQIEAEGRPATEAEQESLMRFIGFGQTDLSKLFDKHQPRGWEGIGSDLRKLVTTDELAGLARATQYAHYTPEYIVRSMWRALRRMGFSGGATLDPGCGTGLFLALMPEGIASRSTYLGVEADPTTVRISKLLHPESDILQADFTKAKLPDGFDLAIGNPPFSPLTVQADDMPIMSLHDHFIARSIERLREGGLGAFVVSRYTMDKQSSVARECIASMADLLAAIRLPAAAMRADAGTDVIVDVLFFRKRAAGEEALWRRDDRAKWLHTTTLCSALYKDTEWFEGIGNQYFAANPLMVLGTLAITSSANGPALTVQPNPTKPVNVALDSAIEVLPPGIYRPATRKVVRAADVEQVPDVAVGTAADGATIKEGSFFVRDGKLYQITQGKPLVVPVRRGGMPGIPQTHEAIIIGLVGIRESVRAILRAQEASQPWEQHQQALRAAYDEFSKAHGPLNKINRIIREVMEEDEDTGEMVKVEKVYERRPNLGPFMDDPDIWLVASITSYDIDTDTETLGPIFTDRVIRAPIAPTIACAGDALAVVLNERGHVDLERIAELAKLTVGQVKDDLDDLIYYDPAKDGWVTNDDYLSGPVRTKLARAQLAVEGNPELRRNVEALEKVQPVDLKPSEIRARLGAPWIPAGVVVTFISEAMGIKTNVDHMPALGHWTLDKGPFWGKAANTSEWGTERRPAGKLIEDVLNSRMPKVYDTVRDAEGKKKQVINVVETEAAKSKMDKISDAFERWVWQSGERAEKLIRIYNDEYNNLVVREFDGSHLVLHGASTAFTLNPHQKRGVWRVIADGSTYIAHCVGAGKTVEVIAACAEQKRLAMVGKPMIVVPGHTLAQWAREWMLLYPNARILVADEENFAKAKRARFLARAATENWDAIIITHSAFKFIPVPSDFERGMIHEQLDNFEDMLAMVDEDDRVTRKEIERAKERLEKQLDKLATDKDDMVTIAEIGTDQIWVDEAQEFRRLTFATNMGAVKGVDPQGSMRAWDLFVKARFVATKNPGRALGMAGGTPITNTMGELFTLLRFMFEAGMYERNVHEFDAWAKAFGLITTDLELQPSGLYKPVSRFAKFVNVPELICMFRMKADVVTKDQLREYMKLPRIKVNGSGKRERQLVTGDASLAFKAYQKLLAARIKKIEGRKGMPKKGDDILLSVITDGRHAAIDTRFVDPEFETMRFHLDLPPRITQALQGTNENYQTNKLNKLVDNVFRIWRDERQTVYHMADGTPYAAPGAVQMVFSDLGTEAVAEKRGFSAYRWIRRRLVDMGIPAEQIAFMQHYKRAAEKLRLFSAMNSGHVTVLIGSSVTMGTGVNAQTRLKALHHLDVPWIPAWIEQREGRIERQGNQNEEIEVYAYATLGSVDATMWQFNERKQRFINMVLAGDKSIREIEEAGDQADQFAMAKAISSGDPRLMQLAGLEADVARLLRLENAHFDDQHSVRRNIEVAKSDLERANRRIPQVEEDLKIFKPTRGDAFAVELHGETHKERSKVGDILISRIRIKQRAQEPGETLLCNIGGFDLYVWGEVGKQSGTFYIGVELRRTGYNDDITLTNDQTGTGLIAKIENKLAGIENELYDLNYRLKSGTRRLDEYQPRLGGDFEHEAELKAKRTELIALKAELAASQEAANDQEERKAA